MSEGKRLPVVLAGHCHIASATPFAGIIACSAPAVVFQLAAEAAGGMRVVQGSGLFSARYAMGVVGDSGDGLRGSLRACVRWEMAETVAFLQVSDTHVFGDESTLQGFSPARNVRRVVEKIGTLPIEPRFCLISGDLAQDGQVASYEHLRRLLQPIAARGVPFLPAVGNHDNRAALRRGFLGEDGENGERLYYARTFGGLRVIVLDSLIPGEDEGQLGEEQLAWLARQLAEPAPLGTILALHHSPAVTGLSSVGRLQLRDAEALGEVIADRPLLGILAGHCHTVSAALFAGTIAATAPAVVFQLAPGASEMIFAEGSGFNLCIVRDGVLVVNPVMV